MPSSVYKHLTWWSNSPTHPLMKEILHAGWMSYRPNLNEKTITFYKDSLAKHKAKTPKGEKRKNPLLIWQKKKNSRKPETCY